MGELKELNVQKDDLKKTLRMLESLNRDHKIDISARIDAYYREEMLSESSKNEITNKEER